MEHHDLVPCGDEVAHELHLRIRAAVDLGEGAQLGVRAEDEVDPARGPGDVAGREIAALEGVRVGLVSGGVGAARGELGLHGDAGRPRGLLDCGAAAEGHEVSERDPLAAAGCGVELLLNTLKGAKDAGQCCRCPRLPPADSMVDETVVLPEG